MGLGSTNSPFLGIIWGSNKVNLDEFDTFESRNVNTDFGSTFLWISKDENLLILPRHGENSKIPPHKINHHANMLAIQKLKVEKVVSFTSVGSLKIELEPSTIIMPDDYINMGTIMTYYDNKICHIVPSLDTGLRKQIFTEIKQLPINIRYNGIYIQTQGPRLETKAEIQMLKNFGDVIGMTMAAEATLANELGLRYVNLSAIDNYCNGVTNEPLTIQTISENQARNSENIKKLLKL